jgi:hypothetical protein
MENLNFNEEDGLTLKDETKDETVESEVRPVLKGSSIFFLINAIRSES